MRRLLFLLLVVLTTPLPAAGAEPIVESPVVPRSIRFPAAGISARVHRIACGVAVLPGRGVYDWRCADPSNRVLLSHAYAGFRPLSRAYDAGRLTRGRPIVVRAADGRRLVYRLAYARVVPRSMVYRGRDGWAWAYGPTPRPSLTLITCRGRFSTHRLVVRFVLATPSSDSATARSSDRVEPALLTFYQLRAGSLPAPLRWTPSPLQWESPTPGADLPGDRGSLRCRAGRTSLCSIVRLRGGVTGAVRRATGRGRRSPPDAYRWSARRVSEPGQPRPGCSRSPRGPARRRVSRRR